MPKISKRRKAINELISGKRVYTLDEAIQVLKKVPAPKFIEAVDLSVNLGVDTRKSDQVVRGSIVLPKGTGRKIRIAVLTSPSHLDAAREAGADIVGGEDLTDQIKAGNIDFDILFATPDAMKLVGQVGQILGPRGLMPNPKDGTVTTNIANAVKNAKIGQARYRADKAGIVHCTIGKVSFAEADLVENFEAVLTALKKAKPSTAKGVYIKKVTLSTTMGPGLSIDISSLNV